MVTSLPPGNICFLILFQESMTQAPSKLHLHCAQFHIKMASFESRLILTKDLNEFSVDQRPRRKVSTGASHTWTEKIRLEDFSFN